MAGIYLHIPFCKQACHYCNFHFSTSMKTKTDVVKALVQELDDRYLYLGDQKIETVYFGGGTPSLLSIKELEIILNKIDILFGLMPDAEITLEANPDDLHPDYLRDLKAIGINRLSIGVQSFFDEDLKFMNRSHDASQAISSLHDAINLFEDISIDLIFGGQYSSTSNWTENLKIAIETGVSHLSCYSLTIEEGTVFGNWIDKNKIQPIESSIQKEQFLETIETLKSGGYEHYEISNYAKSKKYAQHNTNYWKNKAYLGIGPSAHSFDGQSRQWNVANNHKYLEGVLQKSSYITVEILSEQDRYNEYVLTSLRTMWGCKISEIKLFGSAYQEHFTVNANQIISEGKAKMEDNVLYLTTNGKLFADQVTEELFYLN